MDGMVVVWGFQLTGQRSFGWVLPKAQLSTFEVLSLESLEFF